MIADVVKVGVCSSLIIENSTVRRRAHTKTSPAQRRRICMRGGSVANRGMPSIAKKEKMICVSDLLINPQGVT